MWFNSDGRKSRHISPRHHAQPCQACLCAGQAAIDGSADEKALPLLDTVLKPLWEAYHCLKRGRDAREPLELDLPERKIILKPDGTVDRVIVPDRLDAHKLVEEFMIQANVARRNTGTKTPEADLPGA
ncbi:MAG: hypothetical protein R3D29_10000 [Nitratireductor sp.]